MGKIKKILENELVGGTQSTDVYPITSTKAVFDTSNRNLDTIISEIRSSSGLKVKATLTSSQSDQYILGAANNPISIKESESIAVDYNNKTSGAKIVLKYNDGSISYNSIPNGLGTKTYSDINGKLIIGIAVFMGANFEGTIDITIKNSSSVIFETDNKINNLSQDIEALKASSSYNVSILYPTEGLAGGNTYDLQTAIGVLNSKPSISKIEGIVVQFLDSNKNLNEYGYVGGTFNNITSWIKKGVINTFYNIFGSINKSIGTVNSSSNYRCTDYIPISSDSIIKAIVTNTSSVAGCAFYDKYYQYISAADITITITKVEVEVNTIPEDAAFCRLSINANYAQESYVNIYKNNSIVKNNIPRIDIKYENKKGVSVVDGEVIRASVAFYASEYLPIGNNFNVTAYCGANSSVAFYALYDKYFNCIYIEKSEASTNTFEFKTIDRTYIESVAPASAYIRFSLAQNARLDIMPYIIGYSESNLIIPKDNIIGLELIGSSSLFNLTGAINNLGDLNTHKNAYDSTDFIEIDPTTPIYVLGAYNPSIGVELCAFYNENRDFISCYDAGVESDTLNKVIIPENIPEGTKYIRCTCVKGSIYRFVMNSNLSIAFLYKQQDKILSGDYFTIKDAAVYKTGGFSSGDSNYKCTPYLPLNKISAITVNGFEGGSLVAICNFYDKDKKFIRTFEGGGGGNKTAYIQTKSIPINTAYIRCTASSTNANSYVRCDGFNIQSIFAEMSKIQDSLDTYINSRLPQEIVQKSAVWEAEGRAREIQLRNDFVNSLEPAKWYGVEWKEEDNADNVTPINSEGNDDLQTSLPIQNKIRRCVTKNGVVQYYLNAENSELKEDGSPAKLDGTDGNVMVEIPEFFFRCEEEISNGVKTVRLKISEQGLPGFIFSRRRYTSAYEATVNRTTNKLASVCTTTFTRNEEEVRIQSSTYYVVAGAGEGVSLGTQKTALRKGFTANASNYRGGTNDSSLDTETSPTSQNFARNQLGIPIANVNRTDCRALADPVNNIFMDLYDTQKALWILAQTEFKTRNIQKSIAEGGLGKGATVYPTYAGYEKYFSPQRGISCLPCGITNILGNKSGEVYYKMQNVPTKATGSDASAVITEWGDVWMPVMSYRGIENFYGHIYKIVDQINLKCESTDKYVEGHDGEDSWRICKNEWFYEPNPFLTTDLADTKKSLGIYEFSPSIMCVSELLLGDEAHILHKNTKNKDYNTNYCDCSEFVASDKVRYITFNGRIVSGTLVGFHFIVGTDAADGSTSRPSDGTRLNHF